MDSVTLSLKDFVYISTLSDLGVTSRDHGSRMLKLDIVPGEYRLRAYLDGYVLARDGYTPDLKHVTKIFNTRDGDKDLSGTYYNGETKNPNHLHMFNEWLRHHIPIDYFGIFRYDSDEYDSDGDWFNPDWYDSGTEADLRARDEEGIKKVRILGHFHNLPVFYYLNQSVNEDDISQLSLKSPTVMEHGNVQRVWRVIHDLFGDIGVAVLQNKLHAMMGEAGIAFFSTAAANAFGNFDYYKPGYNNNLFANEWVDQPYYPYQCRFDPCNCDWRYKK